MMATSNDLEDAIREVVGSAFAQPGFYEDERPDFPYVHFCPYEAPVAYASDEAWFRHVCYDIVLCTKYRSKVTEKALLNALASRGIMAKQVQWTPSFDEGVLYFEVLTGPVKEIIETESEAANG